MKTRVTNYNVCCKETGELFESYNTMEEAQACVERFEQMDRDDDNYTEDFYEITEIVEPVNDERVSNVSLVKGRYGHDTLTYSIDGKDYNVTGEFYIDENNILHHTHIVNDYFIVMCIGDKQTYVYTEEDVKHGGFVDIDPDDFKIDSEEEANKIKAELENYVAEKGWQNTTFKIENVEEEIEIGVLYK